MEYLHAPWRIEYILAPKNEDQNCSFFVKIAQSNNDEENLVIARSKHCFAVLNRYPYNGGHLMVAPYRQVPDFEGLTEDELLDLMLMIKRCIQALKKSMKPDGFNVGINLGRVAGAGVENHLHIHIVPRWNGDTNFMPVIADTKVVSEALKEVATKVRTAYNHIISLPLSENH